MESEKLIAVHRNHLGEIISFQTSDGRIISYLKAIQEADMGMINGVDIIEKEDGQTLLTPLANNSFDDFPTIY